MQSILSTDVLFGAYAVRLDEQTLRFNGRPVPLAPRVIVTLTALAEQPGRVISKPELMARIWPDGFVEDANLTQNIYVLRKLFEEHQSGVRIENVPRRGYRLVVPPVPVARAIVPVPRVKRRGARYPIPVAACGALLVAVTCAVCTLVRPPVVRTAFGLPPAAFQAYMIGRHDLQSGTRSGLHRSLDAFARVVHDAPSSALGYAGLSESHTSMTFFASGVSERARDSALALGFARRAVSVDPSSAEAFAALGAELSSIERDETAGATAFEHALRLDAKNLDALVWYGSLRLNQGRAREARSLFRRALAVDPSVPGSVASLAWADFLLRDYADAAAFARQLINAHQLESIARITLATADVERRDFARARAEIAALDDSGATRTQAVALRSQVDTMLGRPQVALDGLRGLEAHANFNAIGSWDILAVAAAYARLGRSDAAFVWLERVQASERQQVARDPRFDALRKDKRFESWLSG